MLKLFRMHVASNFILPLLVSTTFFVAFLLTFELFRVLQFMSSKEITIGFVATFMGYICITLIPMAVPLASYFSTIFSMGRMSGDSEYIAFRSFGINKFQLLLPYIVVSLFVGTNVYFLNQQLVPDAHRNVRKMIKRMSSSSLIEGIKSGQFFTKIENITLFTGEVDEQSKELERVFLHIVEPGQKAERAIFSEKGKILYDRDETTGLESFKLSLQNGNILETDMNGVNQVRKILFESYVLPISEKRFNYKPVTKEIMMNRQELRAFIDAGLEAALQKKFKKKDYFNAKYEYLNRLITPILCVLLTFLGFSLGVKGNRGRSTHSSGKSILIIIIYYVAYFSMISVARDGVLPIEVALALPILGLFLYGIKLYRNLDWQG